MMKYRMAIGMLLAFLLLGDAYADPASNLALARKCSPILILTADTGGDYGTISVTKPEPVEIVGADSASGLWFEVFELSGRKVGTYPFTANWNPSLSGTLVRYNWYPDPNRRPDFENNKFAFVDHGEESKTYPSSGPPGFLLPGNHLEAV